MKATTKRNTKERSCCTRETRFRINFSAPSVEIVRTNRSNSFILTVEMILF